MLIGVGGLVVLIWLYLLLFRGGFWRVAVCLDGGDVDLPTWPSITAIIPARNEADVIGPVIKSMAALDYPGKLHVIVVDDSSEDETAAAVQAAIRAAPEGKLIEMIAADPLQAGWAGKVWAMSQGIEKANERDTAVDYYLFCDADIVHDVSALRRLVVKAERDDLDMVSQMVMLSVKSFLETLLIPAFVFFFAKLYPFAWVNSGHRRGPNGLAAAAGGCMLVRRLALEKAGGLALIRERSIDDCALAALVRKQGREGGGRLWLGWTKKSLSIRSYGGIGGIWQMVSRSAYTQLGHSPLLLVGTVFGMSLIYFTGPMLAIGFPVHGQVPVAMLGVAAYGLSALSFLPHLILYRSWWMFAALLPLAALLYTLMTIGSAVAYYRGRGGTWKGRIGSVAESSRRENSRRDR